MIISFTRRLHQVEETAFACPELDASVRGWINHVGYADTRGLRWHMLAPPIPSPLPPWRSAEVVSPTAAPYL